MSCPRQWEVRAVDEGRLAETDVAAFERHVRSCASCRHEKAALEELRELTRQLPAPKQGELDNRRLRARILRDAMSPPPTQARPILWSGVAASALGLALVVVLHVGRPAHDARPAFGGVVSSAPDARWTQTREGPVERVTVADGDVKLRVRKQAPGERFVVNVPDGEVEVRGTTFELSVHDGRTVSVHVDDGVVNVRIHGETVVSAGGTWYPPIAAPAQPDPLASAVPAPSVTPPAHRSVRAPDRLPEQPPRGSDDAALPLDREMAEYERAVDSYRLGRFPRAAELLHAFVAAHPASPLVDDASFIEASSVARAGDADGAARLAEAHQARFPASFHAKDAAILVARSRREHGDCGGARAAVGRWAATASPDPAIASALGRCAGEPAPSATPSSTGSPAEPAPPPRP
jgi:hypothetical protein